MWIQDFLKGGSQKGRVENRSGGRLKFYYVDQPLEAEKNSLNKNKYTYSKLCTQDTALDSKLVDNHFSKMVLGDSTF